VPGELESEGDYLQGVDVIVLSTEAYFPQEGTRSARNWGNTGRRPP